MKTSAHAACGLFLGLSAWAAGAARAGVATADGMWRFVDAVPEEQLRAEPWVRPMFFLPAVFDEQAFDLAVRDAPMEFTREAWEAPAIIELPMPDGTFQRFEVWTTQVMHPDLAAKFPSIRTWAGQGIDDPTALLRMDLTEQGFHSQVLSADGSFYIDPFTKGDRRFYAVYERNDLRLRREDAWECLGPDRNAGFAPILPIESPTPSRSGTFLQTYRTAVAATGEYTAFHGGTVSAGMSAITTAINRVTGVFEREVAIRLQLVANNNLIVYTNAATDPYSNSDGNGMLGQNQSNLDAVIGNANYDIGHVFSTGAGGVASLGVACVAGSKARGVTGLSSPTGDAFYIDYVAHEMGHQYGANHSFNGTSGACVGGNRNGPTAYEPGSGSTIMAYAGICGADNLQSNSDDYFVHVSFDEILAFSTGATGGCPPNVSTGNTVPTINAGANFTIPRQTPFILTPASFGDADGDTLTFCWEERDLGPAQGASGGAFPDNGSSPIIRSFPPSTSPSRIVPRVQNLLNNTFVIGEGLPNTNRTMNFRCTVRDNRAGGGGVNTSDMQVTSTTAAGPFTVTSHNSGGTFSGQTTVTWNVANTNASPVNCFNVKIELSTDGGNTWPITLAAGTPNDGSEVVTLPAVSTSQARLRVMAVGNIFFDINNANFTISPPPPPGAFSLTSPANGATGVALAPTLAWSASANATSYTVTVDTEPAFSTPFVLQSSTSATSLAVSAGVLAQGTTYFWRVVASNASGSTAGSPSPSQFTTVAPPPFCRGDANSDGAVNFTDVSEVLTNWGASYPPGSRGRGDANNDGSVNFVDITTVLENWGMPCP